MNETRNPKKDANAKTIRSQNGRWIRTDDRGEVEKNTRDLVRVLFTILRLSRHDRVKDHPRIGESAWLHGFWCTCSGIRRVCFPKVGMEEALFVMLGMIIENRY
jgi:hypothetical protein